MPRQKLTPEIPNARARTSVPTLIRESPRVLLLQNPIWITSVTVTVHD